MLNIMPTFDDVAHQLRLRPGADRENVLSAVYAAWGVESEVGATLETEAYGQRSFLVKRTFSDLVSSVSVYDIELSLDKRICYAQIESNESGGASINSITIHDDKRVFADFGIDRDYRRMGLGTLVYDMVQDAIDVSGGKVIPSQKVLDQGQMFWMKRANGIWAEGVPAIGL